MSTMTLLRVSVQDLWGLWGSWDLSGLGLRVKGGRTSNKHIKGLLLRESSSSLKALSFTPNTVQGLGVRVLGFRVLGFRV